MSFILLSVLLGFILGKFFALGVLVLVTVAAFLFCMYLTIDLWNKELAFVVALVAWQYAVIGGVVMWITYYMTTGQNWFSQLTQYILR